MPKSITAYDLLISCPSDVSKHIAKFEEAVNYFNNHYGRLNNIVIRTVHWSRNAYPTMGESPQELLNKQIVDEADMVVGVFWTRFGTPTKKYDSGTEEEIEEMISNGKQVFLYFLDSPVQPSEVNQRQYSKIVKFKKKHKDEGIFFEIKDETQLAVKFCGHLELYFNSIILGPSFKENNHKKDILWVDDRPENNIYERKTFEQYGLEVTLALSTQQALETIKRHKYALIISDMGRKEGPREGYVLLDKLRQFDKTTPFIIYAGSRKKEHIQETLDHGGQGCTNDPLELTELVVRYLLVE